MHNKSISIVLATYNGGTYISQQLDSIIANASFYNLVKEIIITDDGSTDNTLSLAMEYSKKHSLIKVYETGNNSGVIDNFMFGLSKTSGDFVMFCDQDDYWLPKKIECMYKEISNIEKKFGENKPALAFSDLSIVDSSLKEISPSFFLFNNIKFPNALKLDSLFLNNIAPGCVCIFNRALINFINVKDTKNWIMHDWWFLLVAVAFGNIGVVKESLMLYRQHGNNVVGAKKKSFFQKLYDIRITIADYKKSLIRRLRQKESFVKFIEMKEYELNLSSAYVCKNRKNLITMIKWGFKNENTIKRKILFILVILFSYSTVSKV